MVANRPKWSHPLKDSARFWGDVGYATYPNFVTVTTSSFFFFKNRALCSKMDFTFKQGFQSGNSKLKVDIYKCPIPEILFENGRKI